MYQKLHGLMTTKVTREEVDTDQVFLLKTLTLKTKPQKRPIKGQRDNGQCV